MTLKRRAAPYSGTQVPPEKSKVEIETLLRRFGADGVSWSENWKQNRAQVQFIIQEAGKRPILVRLEPPPFLESRKTWVAEHGRYEQVQAPNWAQSYRLLKAYLKAKLESIVYGLRDVEEEFLSDVVVRDEAGRDRRVGEIYAQQLEEGKITHALPPGTEEPAKARTVVDTEGRVVA